MGLLKLQFVGKYGKKTKGDLLETLNFFWEKKTKNENFKQCHSAGKRKRGDPLVLLISILLRGPFGASQKYGDFEKNSHSAKKVQMKTPR